MVSDVGPTMSPKELDVEELAESAVEAVVHKFPHLAQPLGKLQLQVNSSNQDAAYTSYNSSTNAKEHGRINGMLLSSVMASPGAPEVPAADDAPAGYSVVTLDKPNTTADEITSYSINDQAKAATGGGEPHHPVRYDLPDLNNEKSKYNLDRLSDQPSKRNQDDWSVDPQDQIELILLEDSEIMGKQSPKKKRSAGHLHGEEDYHLSRRHQTSPRRGGAERDRARPPPGVGCSCMDSLGNTNGRFYYQSVGLQLPTAGDCDDSLVAVSSVTAYGTVMYKHRMLCGYAARK